MAFLLHHIENKNTLGRYRGYPGMARVVPNCPYVGVVIGKRLSEVGEIAIDFAQCCNKFMAVDQFSRERKIMQEMKWLSIRVLLLGAGLFVTLTLGTALYLFAPLASYIFFDDWRFWRHLGKFHRVIQAGIRLYVLVFTNENDYRNAFSLSFTSPPGTSPDRNRVRINPSWAHGESCGSCSQCCQQLRCPLLDKEKGLCMVYGSLIWRYFNCGTYPFSQKEINYFNCPKWQMLDDLPCPVPNIQGKRSTQPIS